MALKGPVICCACLLSAGVVQAQPPSPPLGAGRIEQDIRPEPKPLDRNISIEQPRYPEQVPAGASSAKFILRSVEVQGNKTIRTDNLSPIWAANIGKFISLADAFQFAAAITAKYRDAGYVLSQAIVAKQDLAVTGADLQITVVEGYIAQITIDDSPAVQSALAPYAASITAERPTQLATLERNLLLLNELPGLSARANLKGSATYGASDLALSLAHDSAEFSLAAHNRTSDALGSVRVEAMADFRDTLMSFDRHTVRLISSLNERLAYAGYNGEVPAGASGLKLNWNASNSKSEPKVNIPFNIDSESTTFGLGMAYPVVRSRAANLDVRLRVDASNNSSSEPFETEDKIRAVRVGATWDLADDFGGVTILDVEVAQGLSGLGASEKNDPMLSRNGLGTPDFTKESMYLARLQTLGGPWSLLIAGTGQYSRDVLVTSEQFGLGGDLFLRAYDPSEIVGDYGYAGKAELRANVGVSGFQSTIYAYQDIGKVFYRTTDTSSQSILSTGLGIRFTVAQRIRGYVEAARPRHKIAVSTGDEDVRVFGGIGIDF